ncbi:MAG: homoserine O-succinyltransferase [Bacteroidetes bacterium]|nr:homoserine O-succinyltransferase [Fibrella sp.]
MKTIKIAILDMNNDAPNQGMRCIQQLIQAVQQDENADVSVTVFNVRVDHVVPDLTFDVYISSGGPGNPNKREDGWETPYFQLIDQLFAWNRTHREKKHVFLICHSFQLVMRHLKLGKLSKRKSTSFGIFPIHKTDDGHSDPLLRALPDPFFAVDSRDYQVTIPDFRALDTVGASILCLEKVRPHVPLERAIMAVRFSDEIFGTQFHPEADGDGMLMYFERADKREQVIHNYGEAKYHEMVDSLRDPDKIELTESIILPTFLRRAMGMQSVMATETVSR